MNPKIDIVKHTQITNLKAGFAALSRLDVLVGITQGTAARKGNINNAALMYIHTNGSPARSIPARPVIEPAIKADENWKAINAELQKAAQAELEGEAQLTINFLRKAGQIGADASKRWFVDSRNGWAPNRPSTIRRKGSSQPLIDLGNMRKAITYVVRVDR